MKVVNWTPHAITFVVGDQSVVIEPCGLIVRASQTATEVGVMEVDGLNVPIVKMEYGEPENLPELQEGTINLVSSLAKSAIEKYFPERKDFMVPTDSVRDDQGRIIGCKALGI